MKVDMKIFWINLHDFQRMMSVLFSQPPCVDYKDIYSKALNHRQVTVDWYKA